MKHNDTHDITEVLGISNMNKEQQKLMLEKYYATLAMRVAAKLEKELTQAQLDELDSLQAGEGDDAVATWLENNVKNYHAIMRSEEAALQADLKKSKAELDLAVQKGIELAKED